MRSLRIAWLAGVMVLAAVAPAAASGGSGPATALEGVSTLQTTATTYEAEFLELINEERAADGLQPLERLGVLVEGARDQAQAIFEAGYLFHNPDLAGVTTGWYALGENVGYGPTVIALHDAFMASPGHRANVMKDTYNYAGVGVIVDESQVIWVAVVFMYGPDGLADGEISSEPAELPAGTYTPPFADDDGSIHEAAIAAIADAGITGGCSSDGISFCPDGLVTRAQMASFLVRALDLPAASRDYFGDDTGMAHEAAINALAEAGMTLGCGDGNYCPDEAVTRAQMATFLTRAFGLAPAEGDRFGDDAGSAHEAAINALAGAGIASGCDAEAGLFCPEDAVTRAQMASFLARALQLV